MRKMCFWICYALLSAQVYAADAADKDTKETPQFSYAADLSLIYVNKLTNSVGSNNFSTPPTQAVNSSGQRTLGLGRMALGLDLLIPEESRFHVTLRPDVLNREDDFTDLDTRTGSSYFAQSQAKFLDSYTMTLLFPENLDVAVGVFDLLAQRYMAYRPLLEFGLEVRMPERFAGGQFNWRQTQAAVDKLDDSAGQGWKASLTLLQGSNDRAETINIEEDSQDQAPAGSDAHIGVAGEVVYAFSSRHELGLLVGAGKNDYVQQETVGKVMTEKNGKREEIYGQLFDAWFLNFPRFATKLGFDYRIMKEKWTSSEFSLQSRLHQSLALTASSEVWRSSWAFLGLSIGRSKMTDDLQVFGYQMDGGIVFNPKKNFYTQFAVAEEHREEKDDKRGMHGSYNVDGQDLSVIRRFAIELRYLFDH